MTYNLCNKPLVLSNLVLLSVLWIIKACEYFLDFGGEKTMPVLGLSKLVILSFSSLFSSYSRSAAGGLSDPFSYGSGWTNLKETKVSDTNAGEPGPVTPSC